MHLRLQRASVELVHSLLLLLRVTCVPYRYVNKLNEEHGLPGFFEFYLSAGSGQPVLYIMHPRGYTLEVNLQGANITRCVVAHSRDCEPVTCGP